MRGPRWDAGGGRSRIAAALALVVLAAARPAVAAPVPWPPQALEYGASDTWRRLWPGPAAPARWTAASQGLAATLGWRTLRPGLDRSEVRVRVEGAPWALRVQLARLDPRRFRATLVHRSRDVGMRGDWTVDQAPASAALACNAGQFATGDPWGWLVRDGREEQPPGYGPLSAAVCVDASGEVSIVPAPGIAARRAAGGLSEAFQTYPVVLDSDGVVPAIWRGPDSRVDARHRDSRFGLGVLRDGRLLFALTRLETPGGTLDVIPLGPTTPEMAALMGALGCARAVLLDGGISGQLRLGDSRGRARAWRGLRRVPLGWVFENR